MYRDKIENHLKIDSDRTKMSIEEFNKRFKRERNIFYKGNTSKKGIYRTLDNKELEYESKLEKSFIEILDKSDQIIGIKTQALELEYYYWGRDREYYPDVIYLTKSGDVNILEVKPYEAMLQISNKVKYNKLKEYCNKNGFGYSMLEERGSIKSIKNRELNIELQKDMNNIMKQRNTIYHKRIPGLIKRYNIEFEDIIRVAIEENWQFRSPRSRVWSYSIKRQEQKDIFI